MRGLGLMVCFTGSGFAGGLRDLGFGFVVCCWLVGFGGASCLGWDLILLVTLILVGCCGILFG